jgi:hypothetical protein
MAPTSQDIKDLHAKMDVMGADVRKGLAQVSTAMTAIDKRVLIVEIKQEACLVEHGKEADGMRGLKFKLYGMLIAGMLSGGTIAAIVANFIASNRP